MSGGSVIASPEAETAAGRERDLAGPLRIAVQTYYWKPMAALARALELRSYLDCGVSLRNPILDLGCGDGRVAHMLHRLGIVERPLCGIEILPSRLREARMVGAHVGLARADANRLPFADESFAAVVANGVFEAVPGGAEATLQEVSRVLRRHGTLVCTVPTDDFTNVLLVPKLLRRFAPALARWYESRLNRRIMHFNVYAAPDWISRLERCGLTVTARRGFLADRAGKVWNLLAVHGFRIVGVSKLAGDSFLGSAMRTVVERGLRSTYERERAHAGRFGYLLLVARKSGRDA